MAWVVYVLTSAAVGRTYVGITTDSDRRLRQHNGEAPGGAKATRAGRPWVIGAVYGPFDGRGDALRAELSVKRLRGPNRLAWSPPAAKEAGVDAVDAVDSVDSVARRDADEPLSRNRT